MKELQSSIQIFLLFLLCFSSLKAKAQFIYYIDLSLDYPNLNELTTLSFTFSLDTTITSTDYLKITLPFVLHSSVVSQIPTDMTIKYQEISSISCGSSYNLIESELYYANSAYYVRFKNAEGTHYTGLNSSTVYRVVVKTSANYPQPPQGQQPQAMQLATVSSMEATALTYDSNQMFSSVYLSEVPSKTLNVSASVSATERYDLNAVYPVYLQILPTKSITGKYRVEVILDSNSAFKLTSVCKYFIQEENSLYRESAAYQCSVSTTDNRAYFRIEEELLAYSGYRIQINIQNPSYPVSEDSITVLTQYYYSNKIIEKGIISQSDLLKTSKANIYRKWVNLMYGLSQNAILHHGEIEIENEIQVRISLKTDDSSAIREAGTYVLEGSIFTNLPVNKNSLYNRVNCYISNNNQQTGTRYLICRGVGKLEYGVKYYIGMRITIDQSASLDQVTANQKFGTLDMKVLEGDTETANYLVEPTEIMTDFTMLSNENYFRSSASDEYYYNTPFGVTSNSTSIKDPMHGQEILGMVLANSSSSYPQKLIIAMNLQNTSITSQVWSGNWYSSANSWYKTNSSGTFYIRNGIIFTLPVDFEFETLADSSKSLQFYSQLTGGTTYEASADVFKGYGNADEGNEETIEFIKLRIKSTSMRGLYYTLMRQCNNNYWANDQYISSVMNMRLNSHASFYGEAQHTFDFIGLTYKEIDTDSPDPYLNKIFYFNGYTLTVPRPEQLRYAIVNWYGGTNIQNDALYLPVLIRLAGSLVASDLGNQVEKFMIFFDQLQILRTSDKSWDQTVDCTSTYGTGATCFGFQSEKEGANKYSANYLFHSRIEMHISPSLPQQTDFQLLFPVASFSDYYQINLMFGTLVSHQSSSFYSTANIYRMTGDNNYNLTERLFKFSASSPAITAQFTSNSNFTNLEYSLEMEGTKVGEIAPSVSVLAQHSDLFSVIKQNSGSGQNSTNGAAFTFVCNWEFATADTSFSFGGDGIGVDSQCMNFAYTQSNSSGYTKRYGIFCPIEREIRVDGTLKLNISNLQLPNAKGTSLPDWINYGYSTYLGRLATVVTQEAGTVPLIENGGKIDYYQNVNQQIRLNASSTRLNWTFGIGNYIEQGGYVRVVFESTPFFTIGTKCEIIQNFPVVAETKAITSTCTVTSSSNYIQFTFTNCQDCPYPAGIYTILHQENKGSSSPHTDQKFKIQTYTASNQLLDGVKDYSGEIFPNNSLRYDNDPEKEIEVVTIEEVLYSVWQSNVLGYLQLKFTINQRNLWRDEKIVFDLGDSVTTMDSEETYCFITNNHLLSHAFATIDSTNLSQVIIVSKQDFQNTDEKIELVLQCEKISLTDSNNFSSPSIKLQTSTDQTIFETEQKDKFIVSFDKAPDSFNNTNISLVREINQVGQKGHLSIKIDQLTKSFDKEEAVLSIILPNYYSTLLTSMNSIYCSINNQNTSCIVASNHTIHFPSLPKLYNSTAMVINITGIDTPYYLTPKNITLVFDTNSNSSNYEYYLQVRDETIGGYNLESTILVYNLTVSTDQIRSYSQQIDYNFTLLLSSSVVQQGNLIVISPPSEFDNIFIRQLPPICSLLNYSDPEISTQNIATKIDPTSSDSQIRCQVINNQLRIKINANESRAQSTFRYQLLLEQMTNPDHIYCAQGLWKFAIVNEKFTNNVIATNFFYLDNIDQYSYPFTTDNPFNNTIKNLIWSTDFTKYSGNQKSNTTQIYKHFFSQKLQLSISNESSLQYPFAIALVSHQQKLFTTYPEKLIGLPGQSALTLFINANEETLYGNYLLQFEIIADPYQVYNNLSLLEVNVIDRVFDFGIISEQFSYYLVYSNGNSYPIKLGFIQNLNETDPIVIPDFNFSLQMDFDSQNTNYQKYFYLSSGNLSLFNSSRLSNLMLAGSHYSNGSVTPLVQDIAINLTFTSDDNNLDLQKLINLKNKQIKFYYYFQTFQIPDLFIELPTISSQATQMNFTVQISEIGVLYYTIALSTENQLPISTIKQNCLALVPPKEKSSRQYHYVIIEKSLTVDQFNITVNNLLQNKTYTLQIFAENMQRKSSISYIEKFQTGLNGGSVKIINFSFKQPLVTEEQIAEILCSLTVLLKLPIQKIQTTSGRYCHEFEHLADVVNNSNLNTNSSRLLETTNSTSNQFITSLISTNETIFSTSYGLDLSGNQSSIDIYFLPDEASETDKVSEAINNALADTSNFYYSLYQRLSSLTLKGISELGQVYECQPRFNPRQTIDIISAASFIQVQGFDLASTCNALIYVGLQINPDQTLISNTQVISNTTSTNNTLTIAIQTVTPTFFELQSGQRESESQQTIAVQRKLFTYGKQAPTFNFTQGIQPNTSLE